MLEKQDEEINDLKKSKKKETDEKSKDKLEAEIDAFKEYKAAIRNFKRGLILCLNAMNRVRIEITEVYIKKEI